MHSCHSVEEVTNRDSTGLGAIQRGIETTVKRKHETEKGKKKERNTERMKERKREKGEGERRRKSDIEVRTGCYCSVNFKLTACRARDNHMKSESESGKNKTRDSPHRVAGVVTDVRVRLEHGFLCQ